MLGPLLRKNDWIIDDDLFMIRFDGVSDLHITICTWAHGIFLPELADQCQPEIHIPNAVMIQKCIGYHLSTAYLFCSYYFIQSLFCVMHSECWIQLKKLY